MGVKAPKSPYQIAIVEVPANGASMSPLVIEKEVERVVEVESGRVIMELKDMLAEAQKEIGRLKGQLNQNIRTVEQIEIPVERFIEVEKIVQKPVPNLPLVMVSLVSAIIGALLCLILR